jgi:predicted Zn-dependent protease
MDKSQFLYEQAEAAVAKGDKAGARTLLDDLIVNQPGNEQAWLLLAELVDDRNEIIDCLQHVLAINPQNAAAQQK